MEFTSVKDILNRIALECGLNDSDSPLSSSSQEFKQIKTHANSAAEELINLRPWQALVVTHTIKVLKSDSGRYPLPNGFGYMIPQTQWDKTDQTKLNGALSPQLWTEQHVQNRTPLQLQFRTKQKMLEIFPVPPPNDHNLQFDYVSKLWLESTDGKTRHGKITNDDSLLCLLPANLVAISAKAKFKEAQGMDSKAARSEFATNYFSGASQDDSAPLLNAGGRAPSFRLINADNLPENGYGAR